MALAMPIVSKWRLFSVTSPATRDPREVRARGHRQALADVLEHGSHAQLEPQVAQDDARQVEQVRHGEQQRGLVCRAVEERGEQQVRGSGSCRSDRVQAGPPHERQR
jgi:hypothetical protein